MELLLEPFLGPSGEVGEALPLGLLGLFFRRQLPLLNLNSVFPGQPAQGLRIGELLVLHQERHSAAPLAGTEILENALAGHHVKRWGLLVGERTQAAHARPALLELDELRHHLLDDGGLQDGVDGILRNHAGEKRKGKVGPASRRR